MNHSCYCCWHVDASSCSTLSVCRQNTSRPCAASKRAASQLGFPTLHNSIASCYRRSGRLRQQHMPKTKHSVPIPTQLATPHSLLPSPRSPRVPHAFPVRATPHSCFPRIATTLPVLTPPFSCPTHPPGMGRLQACLLPRFHIPPVTTVNRASVVADPLRAARSAIAALDEIRALRYGEPENEVRRGLVHLHP